jgi:uncharacterized protein (TIGR03067 family)
MTTVTILSIVVAVAAPLPKERVKPMPSVVGEWLIEILNDRPVEPDQALRFLFRNDGTYVFYSGTEEQYVAKYTADPRSAPATLDIEPRSYAVGETFRGIYKFDKDGDVLTFWWNYGGNVRPTKFESNDEVKAIVLRRIRK